MKILLTGATGFIGEELTRSLMNSHDVDSLGLVIRPTINMSPEDRLARLQQRWDKFDLSYTRNASVSVLGKAIEDLSNEDLQGWDLVIHAAATTDLGVALKEARRVNVFATQKLLAGLRRNRFAGRFVHYSTAYVAGKRYGVISEQDRPREFFNQYERTKWESEDAVRNSGLNYTILRPSIVVGRSDNGYVSSNKVLYSVWRAWTAGVLPRAPLDPQAVVDIVPVDYVVNATMALARHPDSVGETYLICSGPRCMKTGVIMNEAVRVFGVDPLPLITPKIIPWIARWPLKLITDPSILELLGRMGWHLPYMGMRGRVFDTRKTDTLLAKLGVRCPEFREYGQQMWSFCRDTGFGKRPLKRKQEQVIANQAG